MGIEKAQYMWDERKMPGTLIGITPFLYHKDFHIPRGIEIRQFYNKNLHFTHSQEPMDSILYPKEKSYLESYVILDDEKDMLYEQRNNFVYCDSKTGFMEPEAKMARDILLTPLV